jgi:hypothetical protein
MKKGYEAGYEFGGRKSMMFRFDRVSKKLEFYSTSGRVDQYIQDDRDDIYDLVLL